MRRLPLLAAAALCAAACHKDQPNPFAGANATATPPPDADIVFTSNLYASSPGGTRDVYAVKMDGSGLTRLTACNVGTAACDNIEAAPAPDRRRLAVRRAARAGETAALVQVNLARGIEGTLLPSSAAVTGIDWSPTDEILVYSANSAGGMDDLFRMDSNGSNARSLTNTPDVRELHPRVDPTGNVAVFGRLVAGGRGEIWLFQTGASQSRITSGGPGDGALPGSLYLVGSDADAAYSPDGGTIVFRRLTAATADGRGTWDLLTYVSGAPSPTLIVGGPAARGAPDWSSRGIVFGEADASGTRLVVVQPDGSGRRVPVSLGPGYAIDFPRWLRPSP